MKIIYDFFVWSHLLQLHKLPQIIEIHILRQQEAYNVVLHSVC